MALLVDDLRGHVVVGGRDRAGPVCAALHSAGIAHSQAELGEIRGLEPVGACGLDGWIVRSDGERAGAFAGVVMVDPLWRMRWLDPGLFDWEAGRPALVAGILAPGLANLYILGVGTACFRGGGAELTVAMIQTQAERGHPLVDELMTVVPPRHEEPTGRGAHRLERRLQRHLDDGRRSWWSAVRAPDGPLAATRAS